jgi:hypothetical protein
MRLCGWSATGILLGFRFFSFLKTEPIQEAQHPLHLSSSLSVYWLVDHLILLGFVDAGGFGDRLSAVSLPDLRSNECHGLDDRLNDEFLSFSIFDLGFL